MPEAQPALTHERLQTPRAAALAEQVSASGRELLTEPESKALLSHYGIPVVETRIRGSETQRPVGRGRGGLGWGRPCQPQRDT
jgi:acyl-CoA synthetase (NDP forming)